MHSKKKEPKPRKLAAEIRTSSNRKKSRRSDALPELDETLPITENGNEAALEKMRAFLMQSLFRRCHGRNYVGLTVIGEAGVGKSIPKSIEDWIRRRSLR